ncbi:hypothetical protein GOM49_13015 [Clostridium bovifaecis]|uniref:Uncharacterized protein n=1 Tax=Clostridium bovifaecis TaxID=2184719 RepID=A0A6I6EUB6_9CLOT|nr:hypothetical protein GOM49_13015 [Clostridium bovifaecis]
MKMREDKEKIRDSIIDKFYEEDYDEGLLNLALQQSNSEDITYFEKKLSLSKNKMDLISDTDFNLDINIIDIINEAEEINNKRKGRLETGMFIFVALMLFCAFGAITIFLDIRYIIYFQITMVTIAPFILIPISKAVLTKGGKAS